MTDSSILERLAALPTMSDIPRKELEWLVDHGEVRSYEDGTELNGNSPEIRVVFVVLKGRFSVRMLRDGVEREVREVLTGGISGGYLPYSRIKNPRGYLVADGLVEVLAVEEALVREMTRECHDFTALCVHAMLDRVRTFKSIDLQLQKMVALGRLSAGLAHELNNPSSAISRSARELDACRLEVTAAARAVGGLDLTPEALTVVADLEGATDSSGESRSSLELADREDDMTDWLSDHDLVADHAYALAETRITIDQLDRAYAALGAADIAAVLRYLTASVNAAILTRDVAHAADRIHTLVDAVKKHTHMDRTSAPELIDLEEHLGGARTILESKASAKDVTLVLSVEPDLPPVSGVVGDLNHVWLNLMDNAIDAAPESGQVSVTAERDRDMVVVLVVDNGPGIPVEDQGRIFEPFFTTKDVGKGAGLGLDVVQTIVRAQGGSVDVTSRPGTTEFRVVLPAATAT